MWERVEGMRVLALGALGERERENALVLGGHREGLIAMYSEYLDDGEVLETPGEHLALLSARGEVVAVVEVDEVTRMRVEDLTFDHVSLEGGEHHSLALWREHTRERLSERGIPFTSRTELVCLRFHLHSARETPAALPTPRALPDSSSRLVSRT